MLTHSKQSLPVQFLKFGVDNNGVIVPILRRNKGSSLRHDLLVRAAQLKSRLTSKNG